MTTPNLGLIELTNSQGQYLNANETFAIIDALLCKAVIDKDLNAPPGSPSDGHVYIVGPSPTGIWAGQANKITFWSADASEWVFVTPREGMLVHVNDEDVFYKYDGSAWVVFSAGGGGGGGVVETVAISSGALDLSGITASTDTVKVTLNQNITSITLPAGAAGVRKDLLILFTQDGTGGRTVTGWPAGTWAADPRIGSTASSITTVALVNVNNDGWKGIPAAGPKVQGVIWKDTADSTWKLNTDFPNYGLGSVSIVGSGITASVRVTLAAGFEPVNFLIGLVGTAILSSAARASASWIFPTTYVDIRFGDGTARIDPTTASVPNGTYINIWGN